VEKNRENVESREFASKGKKINPWVIAKLFPERRESVGGEKTTAESVLNGMVRHRGF